MSLPSRQKAQACQSKFTRKIYLPKKALPDELNNENSITTLNSPLQIPNTLTMKRWQCFGLVFLPRHLSLIVVTPYVAPLHNFQTKTARNEWYYEITLGSKRAHSEKAFKRDTRYLTIG